MSKKINNNILLLVVGTLVVVYAVVKLYSKFVTGSTIKTELVSIDTAKITKLQIYPTSEKRAEITFKKDGKSWTVSKDKVTSEVGANVMPQLINQLLDIKSQRLAAKSKEKWAEYNVTDTAATRVKVFEGDKQVADLLIGKFTYQQSQNPQNSYGGSGIVGTSFVRLYNQPEIYAVNGFLMFVFNQTFDNWRNQTLVKFDKANVTKVSAKFVGDSSFTAVLQGKNWLINGQAIDSAKMANYLGSLSFKNGSTFDDNYAPIGNPVYSLVIEGNNMQTITVKAYLKANDLFEINSSQNQKSWFSSNGAGLLKDVFKRP